MVNQIMANKGQIEYEQFFVTDRIRGRRLNRSNDSPFLSANHLKGFQEWNCNKCIYSVHNLLFVQVREAIKGNNEPLKNALFKTSKVCQVDEWLLSNAVGYYPMEQSKCEGFGMSRYPVSDCEMKRSDQI